MKRATGPMASLFLLLTVAADIRAETAPNVLLIVVDDLRAELACYGGSHVHSPNIDSFAKSGRRFDRAYCQQAVCNPSRTSLMTGLRPDSTGVTGNHSHFRDRHPDLVTLSQHFIHHGYHAQSIGKIFHGVFPDGASKTKWDTMGDEPSWSVPTTRFGPRYYFTESGMRQAEQAFATMYKPRQRAPNDWTTKLVFGPMTESPDVDDEVLYDGKVAAKAVETLRELKESAAPFFLAVGFIKPHSPFVAPKRYWDLYDPASIELSESKLLPTGAPRFAGHGSGEIRRYSDQPKRGDFSEENQRALKHGYLACVSYVDAQVGKVLSTLDAEGLADNTIVVLVSDHGYHLGEHGLWGKTTNFELDTRVPLVIRAPEMSQPGSPTREIVELVDLYPTLVDLAGLPKPDHLEGSSLADVVESPSAKSDGTAISQFPRSAGAEHGRVIGYSLRTDRWRYSEWIRQESGATIAQELYDYADDDAAEQQNLAGREEFGTTVDTLSAQLERQLGQPRESPALRESDRDKATRPNILLIVGEDHGRELSCYGDTVIRTPNIDRLASEGMLFDNGYVTQSVCSPSRSTIFTGLYPHQNGQLGLATHQFRWFEKWPTTYSLLKGAGYRTGLIGKTHILPVEAVEDYVDFRFQRKSNFAKKSVSEYATRAGEFFRESDEPFFLTVNYPDAHWPLQGRVDGLPVKRTDPEKVQVMSYIGHDPPRMRTIVRNYYDCMLRLDACVGQLLQQLDESGKAKNTLVVFIGDHGAQMARGKVTVYEGGMMVPFIARWPGVLMPNQRSAALVSTIDLLPTFADAAGIPVPGGLPGKSLRAIFEQADHQGFREFLVCERNCDAAHVTFPQRTIRDSRYKLIYSPVRDREDPAARYYRIHGAPHWSGCLTDEELADAPKRTRDGYERWLHPPEYQLYDLQNDPDEWNDLASDPHHADTKRRLIEALAEWQSETDDFVRKPLQLRRLMDETDEVKASKRRSPESGWRYLDYLRHRSESSRPDRADRAEAID